MEDLADLPAAGRTALERRIGEARLHLGVLAALVDEVADHGHPVITTSWVLNYLTPNGRVILAALIRKVRSRP